MHTYIYIDRVNPGERVARPRRIWALEGRGHGLYRILPILILYRVRHTGPTLLFLQQWCLRVGVSRCAGRLLWWGGGVQCFRIGIGKLIIIVSSTAHKKGGWRESYRAQSSCNGIEYCNRVGNADRERYEMDVIRSRAQKLGSKTMIVTRSFLGSPRRGGHGHDTVGERGGMVTIPEGSRRRSCMYRQ